MEYVKLENRIDFMKYLPCNSVCAELGVDKGRFAQYLLRRLSPKKLYLIDPYWKKYGDTSWNNEPIKDVWEGVVKRIRKYDKNKVVTLVIDDDCSFLSDLPDNFFDWIYLDTTSLYEDTLREMEIMSHKVKDTGLICGHDWLEKPKHHINDLGVYKGVTEWLKLNPEYYLYLRDNHRQWIVKKTTE